MFRKEVWRHFDYWLFGAVLLLSVFGIIMIRSAVAGNEELAGAVQSQATYVGLGIVIILIATTIDYRLLASLSRWLYILAIVLLIGINLIGQEAFGSTRWFQVGGINIQPSELSKIVMVLVLANYFSQTSAQSKNLRWIFSKFLTHRRHGYLDPTATQLEHLDCDFRSLVCNAVDQRAADKIYYYFCYSWLDSDRHVRYVDHIGG